VKRVALAACALAAAGYVLVVALTFVPLWPLTMLEHFRVQLLLGGVTVVALAWFAPRFFDATLFAWLVVLVVVAPDLQRARPHANGTHVRLLFANVLTSNPHHDRVAKLIADTKPDVVALVETNQPLFVSLAPALAGYAKLEHPRTDNFGLAVYVKGTITGRVEHLDGELPTIVAHLVVQPASTNQPSSTNQPISGSGVAMTVVVTHPWPPVTSEALDRNEAHLIALAHHVRRLASPVVVAGDFNATPWSRPFAKLVGASGLCDTRAGFGYQGSYPSSSAILRIPIDHVLVSCGVGVRDRTIGPDVGSDHLPVIVDLTF
jgi:endonuclease/exonuclease/phosphatase (EEP) superfamily protein YafD